MLSDDELKIAFSEWSKEKVEAWGGKEAFIAGFRLSERVIRLNNPNAVVKELNDVIKKLFPGFGA